jgi:hypothetical protein
MMYGFDELARTLDEARTAHMRKGIQFQSIDALTDAHHHIGGSARIIFGYPRENAVEVVLRRFADDDLHTP